MNVDTMRKIDFYLGVPLCFLLSGLLRLGNFFRRFRHGPSVPKRLLFIELSEMGSTILADPAMRKARRELACELFFVIFKKNKPSLDLLNPIKAENIFTIRDDNLRVFAWDVLRFLRWCRTRQIDTVIDLELFSRATALLSGLSGARYRAGFHAFHNEGLYRGNMQTHNVAYNPHLHIAKNFIALVNALITNNDEMPYSKTKISDSELVLLNKPQISLKQKSAMHGIVASLFPDYHPEQFRIVLVNPNASDLLPQRRWPAEHFIELCQRLLNTHQDVLILLTGAPAEAEGAATIAKAVANPRCLNFAGKVKFNELPTLYSISKLLLTNDSGPAHFAASTDIPTFVIFGPETPALYGSLGNFIPLYANLACSPCVSAANHRKTPCRDNVCVQVIKPAYVFEKLMAVLRTERASAVVQ